MKRLLILLFSSVLFGQANQVFTINPSVYSSAIGNTGISTPNIKNVYHNPAFITLNKDFAQVTTVNWLPDLIDDMVYHNLIYTSSKGFGIELFYFDYGTQTEATKEGIVLGEFQSSSYRLGISYGLNYRDWVLGTRFNLYNHDFIQSVDIKMNYGIDIGLYKSLGNYDLGISLKDLGGSTSFIDEKNDLPTSLGFGITYNFDEIGYLAIDSRFYNDYYTLGLGGNYNLSDLLGIRLGYYMDPDFEVDYLSLGSTMNFKGINIDLAYLLNNKSFHNNTLMLSFGLEI